MTVCATVGRSCFLPDADRDDRVIIACREARRCMGPGLYCAEFAACELVDARCASIARGGCDGQCSRCEAAVNQIAEGK